MMTTLYWIGGLALLTLLAMALGEYRKWIDARRERDAANAEYVKSRLRRLSVESTPAHALPVDPYLRDWPKMDNAEREETTDVHEK